MNCEHVYARKMSGEHVCVKCTSPRPPIPEADLRELNCGLRTMAALHAKDARFELTVARDASGRNMVEILSIALDELLDRRARG